MPLYNDHPVICCLPLMIGCCDLYGGVSDGRGGGAGIFGDEHYRRGKLVRPAENVDRHRLIEAAGGLQRANRVLRPSDCGEWSRLAPTGPQIVSRGRYVESDCALGCRGTSREAAGANYYCNCKLKQPDASEPIYKRTLSYPSTNADYPEGFPLLDN